MSIEHSRTAEGTNWGRSIDEGQEAARMQSEVNLRIVIDHDENLPLDASDMAGEVAKHLTSTLGLSEGRLVVVDGRNHISGPVRVFLQSGFITKEGK